jgi:hypothetical protein
VQPVIGALPVLLLSLAAARPIPEIAFRFGKNPGAAKSAEAVAVEMTLPAGSRADVLVDGDGTWPRWTWTDGADVRDGHATLRAKGAAKALLVVRRPGAPGYSLDGPFAWPSSPGRRTSVPVPRRTVRGSDVLGAEAELRLVGEGSTDALCETGPSGWQCPATPAGFRGRIVVCERGRVLAAAEVRPDLPEAVVLRRPVLAGVLRIARDTPGSDQGKVSIRVMRPVAAGSRVFVPDASWAWSDLGADLAWLEGKESAAGAYVEVQEPLFVPARLPLAELASACADPVSVALAREVRLGGIVSDASGRPVWGALVFARPGGGDAGGVPVADARTGESGDFELGGLELRRYRLRACHPELGCGEADAVAGEPAAVTIGESAACVGRVLSSGGVPEPAASVRIVPTAKTWTDAPDPLTRLPLETVSGGDGRFRIALPDEGDFLLEVRTPSSGVARLAVRRSRLSPAVTDLGDVRLPEPLDLAVRVARCGAGELSLSGPLGGETSLPSILRFRLDSEGAAVVRVPEGGAWTAWAACGGSNVALDPALLPDAASLSGIEVRFEPVGLLAVQPSERSK